MKMKSSLRRSGLTLVELIVVMLILVALSGILVPLLPSMLTRAHTSTCATNMGEVCKAIGEYQAMYLSNPFDFDALTDGNTVISYLAGSGNGPTGGTPWPVGQGNGAGNGEITLITLGTVNPSGVSDAAMLTGVGISTVQLMVANPNTAPGNGAPFDPTFNYYVTATSTAGIPSGQPVVTGMKLAGLDPANNPAAAARCQALNLSPTGRFVCLGVGMRCSMIPKIMQTAPVHFGDQPALNPEFGYQRMVAIYQISDTNPSITLTQARLVGVAPIHDTGVGNIQDELQNAYQLTAGGS